MTKREITPHKGGRDCRPPSARITRTTRERIDMICMLRRMTFADWLTEQAAREHKRITKLTSEDKQ